MGQYQPSHELRESILSRIATEEHQRARRYLLASFTAATVSVAGIVFAGTYVVRAIYEARFYQYVSLLFSDTDIVLSYWREFMLSLAEALPFFAITLVLVAVATLMLSIRMLTSTSRRDLSLSFSS